MPRPFVSRFVGSSLLLVTACASPTQPGGGGVQVRPGGASFTRAADGFVNVPYAVSNMGAATVLLTSRCGDRLMPVIEQRQGGGWEQYSGGACEAVNPMSPVPLAAGATRNETAGVGAAGEYRLVIATDHGAVTSAAFSVR